MTVLKLKIQESSLDNLVNYLIHELTFDYENHGTEMSILFSENFNFINISAQLNMVILKKEASAVVVDIIGGGGGSGLLSIDWGSEKAYTKRVMKLLHAYGEEHTLKIETLSSD